MSTARKTPAKSFHLDDVLKKASPVERTVMVCVSGALAGEYEALKAQDEGAPRPSRRLGSTDVEYDARRARLVELEQEMSDATFPFVFRALSSKAWSDLLNKHPDPGGKKLFNSETFPAAAIAACCVSPEGMDDPVKVEQFMESLSSSQEGDLFDGAWEANMRAPKGMTYFTAFAEAQDSEKN